MQADGQDAGPPPTSGVEGSSGRLVFQAILEAGGEPGQDSTEDKPQLNAEHACRSPQQLLTKREERRLSTLCAQYTPRIARAMLHAFHLSPVEQDRFLAMVAEKERAQETAARASVGGESAERKVLRW